MKRLGGSFQAHAVAMLVALSVALPTAHGAPVIYPAKGQSAEQQQRDQAECQTWATNQTGVDPVAIASQPTTTAPPPSGGRVRGAAGGAAAGAVGGAIAGDAGQGAAIGAAAGAVAGGVKQRQQRRGQQAQAQQTEQQKQAAMANYSKAVAACLEGRGYTVK